MTGGDLSKITTGPATVTFDGKTFPVSNVKFSAEPVEARSSKFPTEFSASIPFGPMTAEAWDRMETALIEAVRLPPELVRAVDCVFSSFDADENTFKKNLADSVARIFRSIGLRPSAVRLPINRYGRHGRPLQINRHRKELKCRRSR